MSARTLFDKLWDAHQVVAETDTTPGVLYIDLHLVHEVTSPQAFDELRSRGLSVRRRDRTLATLDHSTPTLPADASGKRPYYTPEAEAQVATLERNVAEFGIDLMGWDSPHRGIVHVAGPEVGATQPGMTIVCGDSHTATHGAFGALAFGIGTTEVGHVLATQCLLQRKPKSLAIHVDGVLQTGVTAKDLILHIIGQIGIGGGTGHVIEYTGEAIRALSMEERMTVCNMSIEAGARAGLIAPDDITFAWLEGRERVPKGDAWKRAVAHWRTLATDPGASYDSEVRIDASTIQPSITYGTHPGMVVAINATVPAARDALEQRALDYMKVTAGQPMTGESVDVVFIGSCTNARLSDLRAAAQIMRGRRVASGVRMLVVPGSEQVRRDAEREGLHQVFRDAGAEWREPGCSMCIAMNGDLAQPGQLVVSTSNRNFEGRQGKGARTVLASPLVAAASAIAGCVADPRAYIEEEAAA
ncbi:3-isopropylmalate/(R)-2-methylmalate dehydratase large subunit [Luteibacter sp. Sphag1AF]|uniref:3-isopropylmalate dehydratase large subunit n=1 Tax=Luteibacter sp. Sphag1AF TaxID=2587031 RepID=UPI00160CAB24|nr:3-isopropylmalate dehydratase large subunit [Luteibacter sp. Sphag1AF]MBB3227992.1 3-isopropylmalate/(R)-2-methylmalate dehydratase large subunit [Luteibacter sp. Sphag1AF]